MSAPETQLAGFIARFTPDIAACGTEVLARLAARIPEAERLVYDNYNALAVGFGPDERASTVILSVAFYPRWVSLFFMQGAGLDDPHGILKGQGSTVRHVVLTQAGDLDRPEISTMIDQALVKAKKPLPVDGQGRLLIKSVSARQRPRRPGPDIG
ncbi:DUF1801 domain-containing protein [Caulobacter henricii]|uniref:Uncharacterized protein n=1 Tax=Caulobacter henricii TaxID=69395 RepID=A0A0P0P202_9CAUL|nr:DUF1801 domain-containing protein [Caulobacter henricii]ALL14565.1 hypothetical protein AQ619_15080 [Caulobacter henricii]